ncbi:hypothetical protein G4B88_030058 [Cannabis sativa]|uniref:DUF4283 domain-containing protein n=1 Tax=Cannabis sativa TaxID=3483 RepID=A0A7J6FSQ8_CANSA|nr:hypothetical protein G4B88_030058 [Cannabis sativa]
MDPATVCRLFEDSVQISHNDLTFSLNPGEVDEPQEANQVLLGKIFNRHRLGKSAIQGSLKLSWNAIKGWKWKEIEDGVLQFTFARREDALNVLSRRPWFVCGALLVIMPWPAWLSPSEVKFDKTPLWVTIDRIPPFYWNLSNLKELATKASPVFDLPLGIEDVVGMSSLRFRATIELNKPIFSGFYLRRQRLPDLWIQYKYERLPKLCFKCGILTHDQSTCFKPPTVIKDAEGNFFPMYGVWLKKEAPEKSTFSTPLAKWFQDWVMQKKLSIDPTTRNLVKIQRAIQNGDSDEMRENRRQLPGKKRIVSEDDDSVGDSPPGMVITQMPLVYLPGIGEIAPFGNNSKMVSVQDLQEAAERYSAKKAAIHALTQSLQAECSEIGGSEEKGTGGNLSVSRETNEGNNNINQSTNSIEELKGTTSVDGGVDETDHVRKRRTDPFCNNSILGPQAQYLDWPSKECWAQPKAREMMKGALTIDKFFREPTLFNPILDIEDFRVEEHLHGPRKRKASDGIVIGPSSQPKYFPFSPNERTNTTKAHNNLNLDNLKTPTGSNSSIPKEDVAAEETTQEIATSFSPGSNEEPTPSRRRGKGRGGIQGTSKNLDTPKRRGRPPKHQPPLAATPKSFKGGKSGKSRLRGQSSTINHWEGRDFDLKHSHYVPPVGLSGGLGMCWMKGVKCTIQQSDRNLITGVITSDPPGISWRLMGTYGPPNKSEKERFWHQVGDLVLNATDPVLMLGDLNGTLSDNECYNYNGNMARYAFDLRRMVHRSGLIDLGFQGPVYTWAKGGSSSNGVSKMKRARLDRGLSSTDWRILFPNAIVNHLSASQSDHRPLLLDTLGGANCKRRQFKYENMWARDPRCFWVVKEAWKGRLHSNPMINFHRKVKATSKKLQSWNKTHFLHLSHQVQHAQIFKKSIPTPTPLKEGTMQKLISEYDNAELNAIPAAEEIQKAIWDMGRDKAPGFRVERPKQFQTYLG